MTQDHNQDISNLYGQSAKELPDAFLDEQILARAKQTAEQHHPRSTKINSWRKWNWPFSVAASVVLVSLLFFGNLSEYRPVNQDEPFDELDDNQAEHDLVVMQPATQPLAEKLESKEQESKAVYSPETAQLQSDPVRGEYQVAEQLQQASVQVAASELASQLTERTVVEIESRRRMALKVIDEPFLDTLLGEIKLTEARLNEGNLGNDEKRELNKQLADLNQTIFDELISIKRDQPELTIPQKYLALLSEQQKGELNIRPNEITDP